MSQRGSIRKRGATWTAYWFVTDSAGQRVQRSKGGFRTKADGQAHLTEQLGKIQSGAYVESPKPTTTVAAYLHEQWLPLQRSKLKPSTLKGYVDIIEGRIIPHLGGVRLAQLTGGRIAAMYAELRTDGNRRRGSGGLSERSLLHTHTVLRKALADAVRQGYLARNPADDVDRPKPRSVEMKVWQAVDARAFLASVADHRLRACFTLALANGLRRGELLGLRWDDADLEAGRLSVRRARVAAGYEVHEGDPKSGRARVLDLDDGMVGELRRHRRAQLEERIAAGMAWQDTGYVFTAEDGAPLHPQTLAWHFEKAVKAAGVPVIRFHDLRHSCATLALRAGVHPKVVQEMLGHSSIVITLDLYSHVVPGMQREAAAKIGAAIFGS
jgi:integrase